MKKIKEGNLGDKCHNCNHVRRKKIYGIFLIFGVIVLLFMLLIFWSGLAEGWLEWERRTFTFQGVGLSGPSGSIDIRGTGSIGMSGWITFQPVGAYNLTLWTNGRGTMNAVIDGKKYSTTWRAIKKYDINLYTCCFGYTRDWTTFRIRLAEPPPGFPEEMIVELTEGNKPTSGSIVVSTEAIHTLDGIVHSGQVFTGTGNVVIHQPGLP